MRAFGGFLAGREVTKELVVAYKEMLVDSGYAIKSVNSMLASINSLFTFLGWLDCKVKAIKQQRQIFCSDKGGIYPAAERRKAKEKRPPEFDSSDDLRNGHSRE